MGEDTDTSDEDTLLTRLKAGLIEHRGLLAAFIASLCFASQSICVKLLKGEVPVIEVVCLRFFLQGAISFVFGLFARMTILFVSRREAGLLLARGIIGTVAIGLIYFAMFNMPAGMVNTIVFGAPAFVGIFAWVILKERFQYRDILLVLLNLSGIILIAQPPFLFRSQALDTSKKLELIAVAAAVVAMLLSALTTIFIRLMGLMNTSAIKIVFYYAICGTIIPACAGLAMQDWIMPPCGKVRYLLVLIGLLNFLAQSFISFALASTKQSYFVSVVNSNQVPVTIILELIILSEVPNWISLVGTGLVVCSALGVVFREGTISKEEREKDSKVGETRMDLNEQEKNRSLLL